MTKGKTNNPHGRPAGSPNKVTSEMRTILSDEVCKQLEALPQLFEQLEPKEWADLLTKLLKYILPPFDGISIKQDDSDEKIPIFNITVKDQETVDSINRLVDKGGKWRIVWWLKSDK